MAFPSVDFAVGAVDGTVGCFPWASSSGTSSEERWEFLGCLGKE